MATVIVGTTSPPVLKDLDKTRKALAGNSNGNNGVLAKIRAGQTQAARAFLDQALSRLRDAQAAGAGIGTIIALLEQVAASLATYLSSFLPRFRSL